MWEVSSLKVKRFIVDLILEPLIPHRKLESFVVFWARLVVRARKPFIIGITGSAGKSTTTAMIAATLSRPDAERIVGRVGCTQHNMNDNKGLAATLLRFDKFDFPWSYPSRLAMFCLIPFRALRIVAGRYPNVMVLEYGAGPGADMNRRAAIAPPNLAIVTTIGAAHLETMKTLEGIVREKGSLVRAVPPNGLVILGEGHEYVAELEQMASAPVLKVQGNGIELSRNITRAVCQRMGIPRELVESAVRDFKNPHSRLERIELNGMTVIDDTWNANPLSMKLGLDTLAEIAGTERRRLAILGYMGELGEDSPSYHEEIGVYARSRSDVLIGVGELSRHYHPNVWFDSTEACIDRLESLIRGGDCLLVKGSHSVRMSKVVAKLREISENCQNGRPQG